MERRQRSALPRTGRSGRPGDKPRKGPAPAKQIPSKMCQSARLSLSLETRWSKTKQRGQSECRRQWTSLTLFSWCLLLFMMVMTQLCMKNAKVRTPVNWGKSSRNSAMRKWELAEAAPAHTSTPSGNVERRNEVILGFHLYFLSAEIDSIWPRRPR